MGFFVFHPTHSRISFDFEISFSNADLNILKAGISEKRMKESGENTIRICDPDVLKSDPKLTPENPPKMDLQPTHEISSLILIKLTRSMFQIESQKFPCLRRRSRTGNLA